MTKGKRNHTRHRVGAWHVRAILTTEQVQAMRAEHIPGQVGYITLARKYGCGVSTARDICLGITRWAG